MAHCASDHSPRGTAHTAQRASAPRATASRPDSSASRQLQDSHGQCIPPVHPGQLCDAASSCDTASRQLCTAHTHALTLRAVPELARREAWYAPPPLVANGHVHTILAAKLRTTRAVRYHRQLLPTPDGGLP